MHEVKFDVCLPLSSSLVVDDMTRQGFRLASSRGRGTRKFGWVWGFAFVKEQNIHRKKWGSIKILMGPWPPLPPLVPDHVESDLAGSPSSLHFLLFLDNLSLKSQTLTE